MTPSFRLVPVACLLCLAAACQRSPDNEAATAPPVQEESPAAPAARAAAPATEAGSAYACADGTRVHVAFGDHEAAVRWADGRALTLPRAESASKGGGDVYVGDTASLQRDGARLQLHDGDRAATTCEPQGTGATGAARYACDAGTTLTRNDDGSYRAEVPGNPAVRMGRIAGSEPPVYTGASLYLRIGDGDAVLTQGDRANELHCTAR
jgi:hypothetical protein